MLFDVWVCRKSKLAAINRKEDMKLRISQLVYIMATKFEWLNP